MNDHIWPVGCKPCCFPPKIPPKLKLKCEHEGTHATFYDLEINISDDIFVYKLFDKRDDFPFFTS